MTERHCDLAFDQADIEVLACAFATACQLAETDCELGWLDQAEAQKLIARRIMAVAGGGERNPVRLADGAIAYLRRRNQIWCAVLSAAAEVGISGRAA